MFTKGQIINRRRDIHGIYGGQQQGGICTPANHRLILLFTSEKGEEFGYRDGWTDTGLYQYSGEGMKGDMDFVRGNRAIRDHVRDGKQIFLFRTLKGGLAECYGEFEYHSHREVDMSDIREKLRKGIVFFLAEVRS
jgi:5-methylcytosine-specific restriction protein A